MKIAWLGRVPAGWLEGATVALAGFDGFLAPHRRLVAAAEASAGARGALAVLVARAPEGGRLTRPATLLRHLAEAGVERAAILRGAPAAARERLAPLSPGEILDLESLGLAAEAAADEAAVRADLFAGRPEAAAGRLGRPWEIEGRVFHGDRRGRLLGFPTANLVLGSLLRPAFGVYAVTGWLDPLRPAVPGVANLGVRPTVGGQRAQLEVHFFEPVGDLYGRRVRVALHAHIRPERRFEGLEALKAQIERDSARARAILGR